MLRFEVQTRDFRQEKKSALARMAAHDPCLGGDCKGFATSPIQRSDKKQQGDHVLVRWNLKTAPAFGLQDLLSCRPGPWSRFGTGQDRPAVRVAVVGGDTQMGEVATREIAQDPRTKLVAQARTLQEASRWAACEPVDVLLVEMVLADGDGLDLLQQTRKQHHPPEAIVLTRQDDEEAALRAFDLGAAGWLVLDHWHGSFVISVLNVADGGAALEPGLARRLMRRPARTEATGTSGSRTLERLTEREREVLEQVAHGLRSKEVARRLAISDETVNAHVKSIYRKLQIHNRVQLVRIASQAGVF